MHRSVDTLEGNCGGGSAELTVILWLYILVAVGEGYGVAEKC